MIGIIGHGNIGKAISNGLLNKSISISLSDKIKTNLPTNKLVTHSSNIELAKNANVLFICISPEDYPNLAKEIKPIINKHTILVSLSPSHTIEDLEKLFNHKDVGRYMPNTSISVNKGVSIISHKKDIENSKSFNEFSQALQSLGFVHLLDEQLVTPTIGVAGSGIAIVFELLEAMGQGGILNGLPQELAYELAAETIIGAGEMYLKTKRHPASLRDQVCSPGGITIKAVSKLEEKGFKGTVLEAIKETI